MPSTTLNCLRCRCRCSAPSIVSAATAGDARRHVHVRHGQRGDGGGLPKNSRAGTTAAKVANPGGAAGVRPAQIGALTTRAADDHHAVDDDRVSFRVRDS